MKETVNLLLVDDNEVDIQAMQRAFRKQRISNPIYVANDGVEALEMLRDETTPVPRPFLILLDINMPRMNGIEFLHELRDCPTLKDSVVFVLTTSDLDRDKIQAYQFNVAGYLLKSEVGEGFVDLVELLGYYWRLVEMPPGARQ